MDPITVTIISLSVMTLRGVILILTYKLKKSSCCGSNVDFSGEVPPKV